VFLQRLGEQLKSTQVDLFFLLDLESVFDEIWRSAFRFCHKSRNETTHSSVDLLVRSELFFQQSSGAKFHRRNTFSRLGIYGLKDDTLMSWPFLARANGFQGLEIDPDTIVPLLFHYFIYSSKKLFLGRAIHCDFCKSIGSTPANNGAFILGVS